MQSRCHPLTIAAVYEAAEALLARHGRTTTLEVKNLLRNQGFWARQSDVSHWMQKISCEAGWHVTSNGRFRIYLHPRYGVTEQPFRDTTAGRIWTN